MSNQIQQQSKVSPHTTQNTVTRAVYISRVNISSTRTARTDPGSVRSASALNAITGDYI
jgi:hypothetical protein